jgi:hypothetical protein
MRKYGEIAFTSFELVYSITQLTLSQEYLKRAFKHRVAFAAYEKQHGCDLVIPVCVAKDSDAKSYFSALLVKVKNYKRPPSMEKRFRAAGVKLTPGYIDPDSTVPLKPYVSIYMELNFTRAGSKATLSSESLEIDKEHFETYGNHIVMIDQTSLTFIDKEVRRILSALANEKVLKVMCPLRFDC